jgi:Reverse transcriptase (RNA-dependent DNA polymerase)/Endonuclease-reverse transcriptase
LNNKCKVEEIDTKTINQIDILYTNADSLFNKLTELRCIIELLNPKVLAITEVKHKKKWMIHTSELSIENYILYINDLNPNNNRGVIVYVHKSIKSKNIDFGMKFSEYLAIEIESGDGKFLLCNIYRSPSSQEENDKELNSLITHVSQSYKSKKIIIGDFNFNDINWETWQTEFVGSKGNVFIDMLRNNLLLQEVHKPTRARGKDKPSILDLVITDDADLVQNIEDIGPLGKSDHSMLHIFCNMQSTYKLMNDKMNYNKGCYEEFRKFINIDWDNLYSNCSNDIDMMWNLFKHVIDEGIIRFIPKVSTFDSWKKKLWKVPVSKDIRSLIKQKRKIWHKYIETKNKLYLNEFKSIRNKIRNETRNVQILEQSEVAKNCKANPKKFWRYIKSKSNIESSIGDIKVKINDSVYTIEDDDEKAQTFCDYFSSVFTEEKLTDIPLLEAKHCNYENTPVNFVTSEILEKLTKLNITKSAGPDNIHPRILFELKDFIAYPLKLMYEESFKQKKLPLDWRSANISTLFKTGSKSDVSNYRPVSLTSIVCKIMESIIKDNVVEHFKINNLFSKKQFGFIKGRSTVSQLLKIMDEWTEQLENGGRIDVVYTDFEKAFDKVPHTRLLNKIASYGIDSNIVDWIKAFLCNRIQRVKLNGKFSNWKSVLSGIPQGSILGPLLFIIFINDLPEYCENKTDIYLFADDAKIFKHVSSTSDSQLLQSSINRLQDWTNIWNILN